MFCFVAGIDFVISHFVRDSNDLAFGTLRAQDRSIMTTRHQQRTRMEDSMITRGFQTLYYRVIGQDDTFAVVRVLALRLIHEDQ
jgi:hypothetical protein